MSGMGVQLGDKAGLYSAHGEVRTCVLAGVGGRHAICDYTRAQAS